MARCLFVEPFFGGSHKAFADGLIAHSQHEIEPLLLPAGEWRRRMRRGAQELAPVAKALPGPFDVVIATDMLDVPAFLALTRPRFAEVPLLLFMHENQFTSPRLRGTKFNSCFGQVNYLSACAADRVAFNSEFHRRDFIEALRVMAAHPNNWLYEPAIESLEEKSLALPVGVDLASLAPHRRERDRNAPPLILWNHRWEFDKSPEMFARVVRRLAEEGVEFRLALAGDPGENPTPQLVELREALADRIHHFGFIESREQYARLLWESDIAVSSTRHEFFGVGMVEALYCGCIPVAPRRYNYPALVPEALHDEYLFEDEAGFLERLRRLLVQRPTPPPSLRTLAERYGWPRVARLWDATVNDLVSPHPRSARA